MTRTALVLVGALALCAASAATGPKLLSAQQWLSQVPALPASPEAAYAQWDDHAGLLRPDAAAQRIESGIEAELLELARVHERPDGPARPASARDQALAARIVPFADNSAVAQKVQSARKAQADLLQKWRAELAASEQRRVMARQALPACHNDTGAPAPQSIRDVELTFVQQRREVAVRYLSLAGPLTGQLLTDISPRIAWGDAAMTAWNGLANPGLQADLSPLAHALQGDGLRDVLSIQKYIQEFSRLAARPVGERRSIERLYAQAQGC